MKANSINYLLEWVQFIADAAQRTVKAVTFIRDTFGGLRVPKKDSSNIPKKS